MTDQQEKKNKIMAAVYTVSVHTALLLLMFFIVAWRVPNPPFPEAGIELNFGMDTQGSGDVQPEEPVGTEQPQVEQVENTKTEEIKEVVPEVKEEAKPAEPKQDERLLTSSEESSVIVKEKKEELRKPTEKPKEKVEEKPIAIYKPGAKTDAEKSASEGKEGKPGNQGDDKNKTGDKGNPQGTLDGKAMYGKPGGGGGGSGPALDLYGWEWDNIPKPNILDNETGRIVFEIEVDENGDLIKYRKESGSISAASERACVDAIQQLTFSKKSNSKVPPVSKGRITFIIRAQ